MGNLSSSTNLQKSPKLSVGLPVYNGAQWIVDSIESILEQSFADIELIIVDNASNDQTESICRQFAESDKRVKYFRNPDNIGVFRNFNKAFELSSGEYFKWAADSDFCLPGFFEKCVDVLDSRPDVVIAYPQTFLLTTDQMGFELIVEYFDDLNIEDERPSQRFVKYLNREKLNNIMHGVIRVSALKQTSLHRPFPGSDISMVAELSLLGKFFEVRERLFVRRHDAQTASLLMSKETASLRKMQMAPSLFARLNLHTYRFISAGKSSIKLQEKLIIYLYLLNRIALLRYDMLRKIKRIIRP